MAARQTTPVPAGYISLAEARSQFLCAKYPGPDGWLAVLARHERAHRDRNISDVEAAEAARAVIETETDSVIRDALRNGALVGFVEPAPGDIRSLPARDWPISGGLDHDDYCGPNTIAPGPKGACHNGVSLRVLFIDQQFARWVSAQLAPKLNEPGKRGPKFKYAPDDIRQFVFDQMNENGEFSPEWQSSDLERALVEKFDMAASTARERMKQPLEDWRASPARR